MTCVTKSKLNAAIYRWKRFYKKSWPHPSLLYRVLGLSFKDRITLAQHITNAVFFSFLFSFGKGNGNITLLWSRLYLFKLTRVSLNNFCETIKPEIQFQWEPGIFTDVCGLWSVRKWRRIKNDRGLPFVLESSFSEWDGIVTVSFFQIKRADWKGSVTQTALFQRCRPRFHLPGQG